MGGDLIAMLAGLVVVTILSAARAALGGLTGLLGGNKRRRSRPRDKVRSNITETTGPIIVAWGRTKVYSAICYMKAVGQYLYRHHLLCLGEINKVEDILIDNVSIDDEKFETEWQNQLTLDWSSYSPPPDPVADLGNFSLGYTSSGALYATDYFRVLRRPVGTEAFTEIDCLKRDFSGRFQSIPGPSNQVKTYGNEPYGDYEYKIMASFHGFAEEEAGRAVVSMQQDDSLFSQSVNDSLAISQNSFRRDEWVKFETRRGEPTEAPIEFMVMDAPEFGDDRRGNGLAQVALRLKRNSEKFGNGIAVISAVVEGLKVYDPRKDPKYGGSGSHRWGDGSLADDYAAERTYEYSDNPALCILDLYRGSRVAYDPETGEYQRLRYGYGYPEELFEMQSFIDAANYCDELVDLPDGGQQKRYTLGGFAEIAADRLQDVEERMLATCAGRIHQPAGRYRLFLERPQNPVYEFTNDVISTEQQPMAISRADIRTKRNIIEITYTDPENDWEANTTEARSEALIESDQQELKQDNEVDFVTNADQAQRLAQLELKRSRDSLSVSFDTTLEPLDLIPGAVVSLTRPSLGWDQKLFRVSRMEIPLSSSLRFNLTEYNPAAYTVDDYSKYIGAGPRQLGTQYKVAAPTNLSFEQSFLVNTAGEEINQILVSWLRSESLGIENYEVSYRLLADQEFTVAGLTDQTNLKIFDLAAGVYEFRVRAFNGIGIASAYAAQEANVVPPGTLPADVSNLRLTNARNQVVLEWDSVPAVKRAGGYRIKVSPNLTGAQWTDPTLFDLDVPGSLNKITLSQFDGTYLIKARNIANLYSSNAALVVNDLPVESNYQQVLITREAPEWPGTAENYSVVGNQLVSSNLGSIDDEPDFDAIENIDELGGYQNWSRYSGQDVIDLGGVYSVRLTHNKDYGTIAWTAPIESYENVDAVANFDGTTFDDVVVAAFVRTTRDDPTSNPTWSDWTELTVVDRAARAIEYKFESIKSNLNTYIEFNDFEVRVNMLRRAEADSLIVTSENQVVSFVSPFYETPQVLLTIENPQPGDYLDYNPLNTTREQFEVTVRDAAGDAVFTRSVSYVADGAGQQIG